VLAVVEDQQLLVLEVGAEHGKRVGRSLGAKVK
jgi:hypothetical protein